MATIDEKLTEIHRDIGKTNISVAKIEGKVNTISTLMATLPTDKDVTEAIRNHEEDEHKRSSIMPGRFNGKTKTGAQMGGGAIVGAAILWLAKYYFGGV